MITGNETAMPEIITDLETNGLNNTYSYGGLTIRQHFAAMIMQGLMSTLLPVNGNELCPNYDNVKYMSDLAVTAADELIRALNK